MNDAATGIALAGAVFAAGAFAATFAIERAAHETRARVGTAALRMALCLICGMAGAFAQSRGLHLTRLTVAGAVVCSCSASMYAGALGRRPPFVAGLVPLAVVCLSAALDGFWWPIVAASVAAVPFGASALRFPRASATSDTLASALSGATLGLFPAIFVLFAAALAALGIGRARGTPAAALSLTPYVAAFTFAGVLVNLALAT